MNNKITNTKYYGDIADAIRSKNGEETKYKPAEMAKAIKGIKTSGGGGNSAIKPGYITFIDTDGSVIAEYAPDELPLAELPPIPDHSTDEVSLIDGQWDWTLDEINKHAGDGGAIVGPTYETYDGHTHIIIKTREDWKYFQLAFQRVIGTVDISWGDGSTTQITKAGIYGHDYSEVGKYDVTIAIDGRTTLEGEYSLVGPYPGGINKLLSSIYIMVKKIYSGNDGIVFMTTTGFARNFYNLDYISLSAKEPILSNRCLGYALFGCRSLATLIVPHLPRSVDIGSDMATRCYGLKCASLPYGIQSLSWNMFGECHSLQSVNIPQSVTRIGMWAFQQCDSLSSVVLPQGASLLEDGCFKQCSYLQSVNIPPSVKRIKQDTFSECTSLVSVTLPQNVTAIDYTAFSRALYDIHIESTTPPTLQSYNAFTAPITIYVPAASVDAYKAATNWAYWTDSIVGE